MTPDDYAAEAKARHAAMYPKKPQRRTGKTPEAKVSADIIKYLDRLGFYVLRTGAGLVEIEGRKISIGRTGQLDYTCCAPGGYFVAIDPKSRRGAASDAQKRQAAFIEQRGGLAILGPRSVADVRAALIARFGEETVREWENR